MRVRRVHRLRVLSFFAVVRRVYSFGGGRLMLVELGLVEQRYRAVLKVFEGGR